MGIVTRDYNLGSWGQDKRLGTQVVWESMQEPVADQVFMREIITTVCSEVETPFRDFIMDLVRRFHQCNLAACQVFKREVSLV